MEMGFNFGLESTKICFKRKFRWLFEIPGVSASGINALPPSKSARPNISFKETQVEHVTETVFIPGKPDWKPVTVTLYDIRKSDNIVFDWIQQMYDPEKGKWTQPVDAQLYKDCTLTLYSGCGDPLEIWAWENVWPQQVDFGDLSMGDSEIVTVDLTLRYARAYVVKF